MQRTSSFVRSDSHGTATSRVATYTPDDRGACQLGVARTVRRTGRSRTKNYHCFRPFLAVVNERASRPSPCACLPTLVVKISVSVVFARFVIERSHQQSLAHENVSHRPETRQFFLSFFFPFLFIVFDFPAPFLPRFPVRDADASMHAPRKHCGGGLRTQRSDAPTDSRP